MTTWREQVLEQLVFWWDVSFWPRMQGLTDEEYLWCPAPECWTVRPVAEVPSPKFQSHDKALASVAVKVTTWFIGAS